MEKKCKTCADKNCENLFTQYKSTDKYCSGRCKMKNKKVDLTLKAPKVHKKKCRVCKCAFEPKNVSTEVVCEKYNCRVEYAMKVVEKQKSAKEKTIRKENIEQKKKMTIDIMSNDKYRSTLLQPVINEIARIIDFGQACIATENYGKENAGHYISVAANRTICLNLHNLHMQSFESNHWKSGDTLKYQGGIRRVFGEDYLAFMDGLQKHPPIQLRKQEMIELYKKACEIRIRLKKDQKLRTPKKRIELRNQINLELGIYLEEYCVYNY